MASPRTSVPSIWDETNTLLSFDTLHRQIDRLFEELGQNVGDLTRAASGGTFDFLPSSELTNSDKEVVVRVELPGVDMQDVDISVTGRTIDISGEKKSEVAHEEGDSYSTERNYGSFHRGFVLPFSIDADKVEAKLERGVLTVRIAKPADGQGHTRKIAIRS